MTTNANGYLYAGADSASCIFVGVAVEKSLTTDVTTDADGKRKVRVFRTGVFQFAVTATATQAWVGFKVYLDDDNTVDLTGGVTNHLYCGKCVEFISATLVKVDIGDAASAGA